MPGRSAEVERALERLTRELTRSLPVTVASVGLRDGPSLSLRVKAASAVRSLPSALAVGTRVPLSGAPWLRMVLDRKSAVLLGPGSVAGGAGSANGGLGLVPALPSVYLAPIRFGEETVGVLGLGEMRSPEREPICEAKRARCHALLDEFVEAAAQAWQAERLRRQVRAMSSLFRMIEGLAEVRCDQDVLACLASEVAEWLGSRVKGVLLGLHASGPARVLARWNLDGEMCDGMGVQLVAALAREGERRARPAWPVRAVRVADDPLDPLHPRTDGGETWTRICLPLMKRDELLAIACLYLEDDLHLSEWELDAFRRRATMATLGLCMARTQGEWRDERAWHHRLAWEILTTHQRTVLRDLLGRVESVVSARLQGRPEREPVAPVSDADALAGELGALVAGLQEVLSEPGDPVDSVEVNELLRRAIELVEARRGCRRAPVELVPLQEPLLADVPLALVGALAQVIHDAADAAGPSARIRVQASRDDGHVLISVADGHEPASAQRDAGGAAPVTSGGHARPFGLSAARALVEAHGGEVHLECGDRGVPVLRLRLPVRDPSPARSSRS